jgi:hypothetical protein
MIKQREFEFLKNVLKSRLEIELKGSATEIPEYQPEEIQSSELTSFIRYNKLSNPEVITLLLEVQKGRITGVFCLLAKRFFLYWPEAISKSAQH